MDLCFQYKEVLTVYASVWQKNVEEDGASQSENTTSESKTSQKR